MSIYLNWLPKPIILNLLYDFIHPLQIKGGITAHTNVDCNTFHGQFCSLQTKRTGNRMKLLTFRVWQIEVIFCSCLCDS
jgi:hypothetical protein